MTKDLSNVTRTRVAKNTVILFLRMLVLTFLNLYMVRLVLHALGEEDYGIFNSIAGVITSSSFLATVFAMSIQRFYSISMGNRNLVELQQTFSISLKIIIVIALTLLILFESCGLWFIHNKLIIPPDRLESATIVFHLSLIAFIFSFLQIPYSAAIFAHENMDAFAIISTIECVLKLITSLLLFYCSIDRLVFYGSGLLFTALFSFTSYLLYAKKNYSECSYIKTKRKDLLVNILSFSGWAMYGSIASVCMTQGNTILLNMYFGPLIVASFSIALQINNAFNTLANNIVMAFRPAMIKLYAEKDYKQLNSFFNFGNKFILYSLLSVGCPLIFKMDIILKLWLGDYSQNTLLFARLIIIFAILLAMNNPITIIIHAIGKMKYYSLSVESITILSLPLSWIFLKLGKPAPYVFTSLIGSIILAHIVRIICLKRYYQGFHIYSYIKEIIIRSLIVVLLICFIFSQLNRLFTSNTFNSIIVLCVCFVFTLTLGYFIGLNSTERKMIKNLILSKVK